MAHFAIVCPQELGHLLPLGQLGRELVNRRHRVTVIASAEAASKTEQLGLPLYPLDMDTIPYCLNIPLWLTAHLCGAKDVITLRTWLQWCAEGVLRLVPPALKELAVDGALIEQAIPAAGTAAEHVGVPFVTVCSTMLWNEDVSVPPFFTGWPYAESRRAELRNRLGYAGWRWFIGPMLKLINQYRHRWQLPRFQRLDDASSSLAQIAQLCPEFDFPRRQPPDVLHYVGSLSAKRQLKAEPQFPWERLDGRPLIFASLGTVSDPSNVPVFRKILAACTGLEAQLVLALGRWDGQEDSVRGKLGKIPGDAVVVDFAPQHALLDRAALLITHAGANTVLESISRAVPMVALPRSADQPAMGSRIVHAGVGLRGSFWHSSAGQIRQLVQAVLADDSFRHRAKRVQKAMLAAGGVSRAADIVEEAFSTRQPVIRRKEIGNGGQASE
jgi:MGT family glycosyltransferase